MDKKPRLLKLTVRASKSNIESVYDVAMMSHFVTMVTRCLNLLAFVQALICENFSELLSFVYDMYCC